MTRALTTRRWYRLLALLLGLALVAAACGNDDDSSADDGSDDAGVDDSGDTRPDPGEPVSGGKVTYGLEADSANPWTPQYTSCAISCHMVMRSVYDPLTMYDANEEVQPYLLESFEANDDFTEWTLTPREGVTFHDGTPFDAMAIVVNLMAHKDSPLTGDSLLNMVGAAPSEDGSAAIVTMTEPWAAFPAVVSGQIGYMASPTWLGAVAENPAVMAQPVGTGPFVFESYEAGNNYIGKANPDYWRDGLPYLDEIEFRVMPSVETRKNALLDGQIDILHTSNGQTIAELRSENVVLDEAANFGETGYILLNVGHPDSPITDVRIRRALAMATEREILIDRSAGGVFSEANGPFGPSQIGYLDDSGYPAYDPDGARALVQEYLDDTGESAVSMSFTTTTDPANLATAELLAGMWGEVGIEVELAQIEQGQFIDSALVGNFEMFQWRNHGGIDPSVQRVWWHSETARDVGSIALNFGRIKDDVIDEQLDILRSSDDDAEIQTAAETINRQFADQVYNLWNWWTEWGIAYSDNVYGVMDFELPDGSPGLSGVSGGHQVVEMWVAE